MEYSLWKSLVLLALLCGCGGGGSDNDNSSWVWRNPLPRGNNLNDVAWNGEQLVVVGNNGTILTSTNAQDWMQRDPGVLTNFNAVIWTGEQFVAVGGSYFPMRLTGLVATSTDGVDWRLLNDTISSPLYDVTPLNDVAWDGNQLIAVSQNGSILGSYNGVEWDLLSTGEDESSHVSAGYRAITWAGERFIAVGTNNNRTPLISTSVDGSSWRHTEPSCQATTDAGVQPQLIMNVQPFPLDVAWTGNQAVIICPQGVILTSPDGHSWSQHNLAADRDFINISWAETQLVATTFEGAVYTSDNGLDWAQQISDSALQLSASTWTGSAFVAVGPGGTLVSSTDDMSWRRYDSSVSYAWLHDVIWSGSRYIAVGSGGEVLNSTNGIDWTLETPATDLALYSIIWTGDRFYAVGEEGVIISSPDGSNWTVHERVQGLDASDSLNDIAWSGSIYAAVGEGRIITSVDGVDWKVMEHNDFNLFFLDSIEWSGTEFVAVGWVNGFGTAIVSSEDGTNWSVNRPTLTNGEEFQEDLTDISFNGEQFVALAEHDASNIYTSRDGIHWIAHEHGITRGLRHTLWTGSNYIAVGYGVIASSENGVNWKQESALTSEILDGIASSGQQTIVVGRMGIIVSIDE
ncbi:MAG: hypothetical protein AB2559_13655 [Candidatus Thiodiazotropha endolucinida]